MSVAQRLPSAPMQISPGMTHPPSRLCLSDLRHGVPYKIWASTILAVLPRRAASYPLPVRQASALPSASSRFAVTHDTLAVRLTLPLVGRVEDFHLQVSAPCRAHQQKTAGKPAVFLGALACLQFLGLHVTVEPRLGEAEPLVLFLAEVCIVRVDLLPGRVLGRQFGVM